MAPVVPLGCRRTERWTDGGMQQEERRGGTEGGEEGWNLSTLAQEDDREKNKSINKSISLVVCIPQHTAAVHQLVLGWLTLLQKLIRSVDLKT